MKALIVEDEGASARNLKQIIDEIGGIDILEVLDSIEDTVEWFGKHDEPDVLFMDIHLADGSSFEIFNHITISCPIIFTTAYDEHALEAFRVNSISYLLKPVKPSDVTAALRKLTQLQGKRTWMDELRDMKMLLEGKRKFKSHILVSMHDNKLLPLEVTEIGFINIEDGVVKIHALDGKRYFPDQNLDEFASMLNPQDFYRANRQFIIARKVIRDVDTWFNHRLSVNLEIPVKDKIIVSKARVSHFKNWLSGN